MLNFFNNNDSITFPFLSLSIKYMVILLSKFYLYIRLIFKHLSINFFFQEFIQVINDSIFIIFLYLWINGFYITLPHSGGILNILPYSGGYILPCSGGYQSPVRVENNPLSGWKHPFKLSLNQAVTTPIIINIINIIKK